MKSSRCEFYSDDEEEFDDAKSLKKTKFVSDEGDVSYEILDDAVDITTSESESENNNKKRKKSDDSDSEEDNLKSTGDEELDNIDFSNDHPASPEGRNAGKRCKAFGDEFDDLICSPDTPIISRIHRSYAFDANDPAFNVFRDGNNFDLSPGSNNGSPGSIFGNLEDGSPDGEQGDDRSTDALASLLMGQTINCTVARLEFTDENINQQFSGTVNIGFDSI